MVLHFNLKYGLEILRHGAQVIAAINCFKISHSIAVFDFIISTAAHSLSKQPDFLEIIAFITKPNA